MNKDRDGKGKFIKGHVPLFDGGIKRERKLLNQNYTKKLQKMLKEAKK